ncbi:hypothetical protein B0T17DRAFT_311976 [Bombardia bombarda]|uniref:Uncharacterized protein n=1 Tax=Bombardia bombarda TaxID=252184 RepID=A0AA40BY58_9PEZI|nr:hypothetical protein B0T17DRAFT_311976 [Bombardia bombarda]
MEREWATYPSRIGASQPLYITKRGKYHHHHMSLQFQSSPKNTHGSFPNSGEQCLGFPAPFIVLHPHASSLAQHTTTIKIRRHVLRDRGDASSAPRVHSISHPRALVQPRFVPSSISRATIITRRGFL